MNRIPGAPAKLLVLCVDRDNDIEEKTGVKTPIVGREACLDAGSTLALADPEEADANAVFAAVKQLDLLLKRGYDCEVVVISGVRNGSLEADLKIRTQLRETVGKFEAQGVVLVSDGSEDQEVIPVIQNIVPVVSVRRVIVKHSKSVEETYAVLGRYLRMLAYDSRYSRIALGVPGIVLLMWGISVFLGQERVAILFALSLIGVTLLIRGFDLDKLKPSGYVRLFSILSSILIIAASLYTAFVAISSTQEFTVVQVDVNLIWRHGPFLAGKFIQESLTILWIGLGVYFAGGVLINYVRGSIKMVSSAVGLVILALLYLPILQFSQILTGTGSTASLVSFLLMGLAVVFLIGTTIYMYVQSHRGAR